MAKYRQVHISFWQDPFIEELEPMQKYFYLYLMTNSKTTQCGCFEISNKLIKYETGLSQDEIDSFIELFTENKKIVYSANTNEFLILNWLKHNSFKSPKVKSCIQKEIENIKNVKFIDFINAVIEEEIGIDRLSIDYPKYIYSDSENEIPVLVEVRNKNKKENKKENNNNKEKKEINISFEEFWEIYKKKIGRSKCNEEWNKLSDRDREMIMVHIPIYENSLSDLKFLKNPETYLNSKLWLDIEENVNVQSKNKSEAFVLKSLGINI